MLDDGLMPPYGLRATEPCWAGTELMCEGLSGPPMGAMPPPRQDMATEVELLMPATGGGLRVEPL